jgi:hypothetical protein
MFSGRAPKSNFHMVKLSRRRSLSQTLAKKKEDRLKSSKRPSYEIEEHKHRFAAWAASRAASVRGCRFSVEKGKAILEGIGLGPKLADPKDLPPPDQLDAVHRAWRRRAINLGRDYDLVLTHGVAAKLINCYLKSRFICGGYHQHNRVQILHPPIDEILLKTLAILNVGGHQKEWRRARLARWSKFNSRQYEEVIARIRSSSRSEPLWMIEEHWKGNQ